MHDFAKKIKKQPVIYLFIFLLYVCSFYTEDEDKNVLFDTVVDVISELFVSAVYDRRPRLAVQSVSILLPAFSGIPFPVHIRVFLQCPAQLYSPWTYVTAVAIIVVLALAIRFLYFEEKHVFL